MTPRVALQGARQSELPAAVAPSLKPTIARAPAASTRAPSIFSDLAAVYANADGSRDWLAEGAIEGTPIMLFAGPEKTHKSWTAMGAGVAVATASKLLGRFAVLRPGPVIYCDFEYGAPEFVRRIARIARGMGREPREVLPLVHHLWSPALQLDPGNAIANGLMRAVKQIRPSLLVIDPWRNAMGGDENSTQDTIAAMDIVAQLRDAGGCAVWITHHLNRSGSMGGNRALKTRADLIIEGSDEDEPAYRAIGRTIRCCDPISNPFTIAVEHEHDDDDRIAKTRIRALFEDDTAAGEKKLSKSAVRVRAALLKSTKPMSVRAVRNATSTNHVVATRALAELLDRGDAVVRAGEWSISTDRFFEDAFPGPTSEDPK